MSRILKTLVVMLVVFSASANAAEVVSMKLCTEKDFDPAAKDCSAGKALEGSNIVIAPDAKPVYFLSAIKTAKAEEIYHVWIFNGKTSSAAKVTVYDSTTKTLRDAEESDMNWLKERKIENAQFLVKLTVGPSPRYRTRSQKTLGPKAAGPWLVQIYDSANTRPIAELSFAVTPSDNGITNEN